MRGSGGVWTGPNFAKSCAGIWGIPPPTATGAAAAFEPGACSEASRSCLLVRCLGPVPGTVEVDSKLAGQPSHARTGMHAAFHRAVRRRDGEDGAPPPSRLRPRATPVVPSRLRRAVQPLIRSLIDPDGRPLRWQLHDRW